MEAAPRLPMISFELKVSTEHVSFGPKLKQYIASFYHEDPESYNNEIHGLESLRATAVRPAIDVAGCQTLKQYYCQLNFLKSRFPMEKGQAAAVSFSWKDLYSGIAYTLPDINFELNNILHNIGALHTQLGAADSRSSSEGMKMSCTHFQCAAWTFQHLKENYLQMISISLPPEVIHFMHQLCLAQAQECILEKSMMDNRKSTIIAKVAVQVVDYYNQALSTIMAGNDCGSLVDVIGSRILKDWSRYLKFKVAYHSCVSFLYQGQQAEEAQKMGERVAFYQAASEHLEEARKIAKGNMGQQQNEVDEALAFTQDVVEGKRKAAKNENEFIYHEVVPERDALQQVNGASLVKGTPFSVNDPDVSGKDLFQRLVPMEAHESSSVYSEQKAEMLRQIGAIVDTKDAELAEFMSSLQLDCLNQWRQAIGVPQDIVDRAAALCAKPQATQALVEVMGRLANTCHEVESLLNEIQELVKEEETKEQEYQKVMGNRPLSIVSTDLSREAGKYTEAHSKANESNQTLHRAMTMHMSNLKILGQPLTELKKAIPSALPGDPSINEGVVSELEALIAKVEEMRVQRSNLLAQLREAVFADDITALLVTKPPEMTMEQLFQKELGKHKRQAALIEQNLAAQDNILSALTDVYAKFAPTRRYILDVLKRREVTTSALIASYDAYDDLLAKANKGIEFYQKLEGNVSKLQQRIKSACRVNEEEREQMLAKLKPETSTPAAPKLKDYLASMRTSTTADTTPQWVPSIRPTPLGQEETNDKHLPHDSHVTQYPYQPYSDPNVYYPYNVSTSVNPDPSTVISNTVSQLPQNYQYSSGYYSDPNNIQSQTNPNNSQPYQTYQMPSVNDPRTVLQNYPVYNPEPTQPNYQTTTMYNPIVDQQSQSVPQNYQIPNNYQLPSSQNYQNPASYYQTPAQYPQNYNISSVYFPDSYTPSSTPQQNNPIPGIYSPSTDTSAPSQKLLQADSQVPANYSYQQPFTAPNYQAANTSTTINAGQQYQAPTEEYQQQYQYIPQYYPQQQALEVQPPTESFTNPMNYYAMPYGHQTPGLNSMTMMQANNNTMTSSRSSSISSTSNVDLLTGLDFSVGQAPLQPQVNVSTAMNEQKKEKVVESPAKIVQAAVVEQEEKKQVLDEGAASNATEIKDPLEDPETFNAFSQEVEKLEKFVDGLTTKTLNGPTPLDIKWKEIQEQQDRDAHKCSISVARCYPMKNRFPDILPYDHSRVELPSTKDDYINASHVKGISLHSPPFIVTQAPLKSTLDDLWTMVWEQQIEVIVCMLGDAETKQEGAVYWPTERGSQLQTGKLRAILQGINNRDHWIERIISLGDGTRHLVVVHLQFTGWPGSGLFPTTASPLISFAGAVLACHRQQRVRNRPVLVHCLSGVGRSGVLCLLIAAMCDPVQTLDVAAAASRMSRCRKNILRDREHLKFSYQAVLQHAKDLLSGRQLQAKLQNVNISDLKKEITEESSSRRSSASSEITSFDQSKPRKKFTPESFGALKEQGITPVTDTNDPLSALDPLWSIRK